MRSLSFLFLLPLAGCVTPCHQACELVQAPLRACEHDLASRSRVQVFIVNGSDPFVSMTPLREKLHHAGFAKVSSGGLLFASYFESTIRQLHNDDPEARVVLVGYGLGVASADSLAKRLQRDGLRVDSVIAMAPRSFPGWDETPALEVPRIVIRAKASPMQITDEKAYSIPDASSVAGDEAAAELVLNAVIQSVQSVPAIPEAHAALALIDNPAPRPQTPRLEVKPKPVQGILTSQPK